MAPVQTDQIILDVESFIRRYVVLPPEELRIVSAWVLHTWQFSESCPSPVVTPYLYVHSAQKGSGKTLLMDTLEVLIRNPMQVVGLTAASLFRVIAASQPTMMIDEVDTIYSGSKNEELRGVLNSGYRRGGKVPRVEGKEVVMFSTFGPKLIGGIDNAQLPDTVRDRCIPIEMKRATDTERKSVQPFYHYEIEDEAAELVDRLHSWSIGHGMQVRDYRPKVIESLSPRQWEISMPLLQIGNAARCEESIRTAIVSVYGKVGGSSETIEQRILKVIHDLFEQSKSDKVYVTEILEALEEREDITLSGKGLSVKLAPFGPRPGTIRKGQSTGKGYYRHMFTDAFDRYL